MSKTFLRKYGGGGGIRTHEAIADLPVFKTGAFNQALPPFPKSIMRLNQEPHNI